MWLIGMSASGKTTIGKKLFDKLVLSDKKWIFLDGDTFRNILEEDLGHSIEDRRKNAYRISRFCEFLSSQDINVLACVLSIFHDNQKYNKENISDYKEVYVDVSFENLVKRDNKQLYKKALNDEIKDVVGVDIEFKPPYSPDMIIDNNKDNPNYEQMVESILVNFNIEIDSKYSYTQNNLLENPHKYQYSKFEGKEFFDKLIYDRNQSKDYLSNRLKKLNNNLVKKEVLKYNNFEVESNLILKDFLIFLYQSSKYELLKYSNTIDILIKRFEVGKKLYLTYDLKEIRKSSVKFDTLLNYPFFSLVLQKYYTNSDNQKKFVYLNAILKVNDIISSIKSEFILYDEVYYSIEAINNELKIIGENI
jgi:adenylylsulfate kinase